jgi:hypothetical protein
VAARLRVACGIQPSGMAMTIAMGHGHGSSGKYKIKQLHLDPSVAWPLRSLGCPVDDRATSACNRASVL